MLARDSASTNLTAEFFVASQLFRLGLGATLTLGHTKEIDLIAVGPTGRTATIDVKGLKNTTNWPFRLKRQTADHFFVLVSYRNRFADPQARPETYVIPSLEITSVLKPWSGHATQTGVSYSAVKGGPYYEAWDLLLAALKSTD